MKKVNAMRVDASINKPEDGEGAKDIAQGQPINRPVCANQCTVQTPLWESDDDDEWYADYFNSHVGSRYGGQFNRN